MIFFFFLLFFAMKSSEAKSKKQGRQAILLLRESIPEFWQILKCEFKDQTLFLNTNFSTHVGKGTSSDMMHCDL